MDLLEMNVSTRIFSEEVGNGRVRRNDDINRGNTDKYIFLNKTTNL
jgi:hypothetical protein